MSTPTTAAPAPTSAGADPHHPTRLPADHRMTDRRMEILVLMANGHPNAEIAKKLWLSEDAVKSHVRIIYEDLGARDRTNAAAIALVRGLIQPHQVHLRPPRGDGT